MNINKNNYEEYFLLYADNELSKAERKMVEVFVNENPELKEEFCMLKLTINIPDEEIKLDDKSFLFKNESSFSINENNYEERFVLYHDNELSEKEKVETQRFVAKHPNLKTEFELIGKAKLSADPLVVYPDKKELYRKEKKGIVVSMMIWRYVAAAVLIGFGLWISVPYFTNSHNNTPVVAQVEPVKSQKPKTGTITPEKTKEESNQVASTTKNEEENTVAKAEEKKADRAVAKTTKNVVADKSELKIAAPTVIKKVQQLKPDALETVAANTEIENTPENLDNYKKQIAVSTKTISGNTEPNIQPNYSQTAAYKDDNNDNYVFYDVPAEQFNKTKVGGFLKKVKRIVERTNPITRLLEGNEEPIVAKKF